MPRWAQFAALLALLTLAMPSPAQEKPPSAVGQERVERILILNGEPVGVEVGSHAGEICLVCDHPIGKDDVTYLVHGQRVSVHRLVCHARLIQNPGPVLARLQPRGAFLGAEMDKQELAGGWFVFGVYVLLGLFFGATCAHRALSTGRNPVAWFLLGFLFNVAGYAALSALPRRASALPAGIPAGLGKIGTTRMPAACSMCGAELHPSATLCPACGAMLRPNAPSEVTLAMRPN